MSVSTPADHEAEQAVLGAVLLSDRILPTLIVDEDLRPEHFSRKTHQQIYRAILTLHDQQAGIDPLTVARQSGTSQDTIETLAATVPAAGNARHYARIVKRAHQRRRWHQAASLLLEAAETDSDDTAVQAEALLAAPTVTDDTYTPDRLRDAVWAYLADTTPAGIPTGFRDLDDILGGGFRRGDTTVLAAWESTGKSALLLGWLDHAVKGGLRCHLYINEMSPTDIALRMLAHRGAADWGRLARKRLDQQETDRVTEQLNQGLPFGVTDCSAWTADQIARHIRVNRWDLVALDVLHNIPYQRESELHQIVATLAAAARTTGGHLVLVCHLNQERAREDTLPEPVIRDLRGSGMIAKIAANVLMLHRPQHRNSLGFIETGLFGTLVAHKARHGRRGDGIEVVFEPQRMRFRVPSSLERQAGVAA